MWRSLLLLTPLLAPLNGFADYSIRALEQIPYVSSDESLIAAAAPSWILIKDNLRSDDCLFRVNIKTNEVTNLCDKGVLGAAAINSKGSVLGKDRDGKQLVVWNEKSGLKVLSFDDQPNGKVIEIIPRGISSNGWVAGGLVIEYEELINGEVVTESRSHSYIWSPKGKAIHITPPRSSSSLAIAVNARGESLVVSDENDNGSPPALYRYNRQGKRKRIDRLGETIYPSSYNRYEMNNQGKIITADGNYYTSKSGWRLLPNGGCGRCDGFRTGSLSPNGNALYQSGETSITLYTPPHLPNQITCMTPQNQKIGGLSSHVSDLAYEYLIAAFFLDDSTIVTSSNIEGDDRNSRIFLIEGIDGESKDYCPKIDAQIEAAFGGYCPGYQNSVSAPCEGTLSVSDIRGVLSNIPLLIRARQELSYEADFDCAPVTIKSFKSRRKGTKFNFSTDPGFTYTVEITDPKYRLATQVVYLSPGQVYSSPLRACRAPLEGISGN